MTPLLAGLALGIASSAHCAAMCGPLVVTAARAVAVRSRIAHLGQMLLHHAARILVYAALAVPAGLAGETLAVNGFGRAAAIVAGLVLLAAALGSLRVRGFGRLGAAVSTLVALLSKPVLRWSVRHAVAGPLLTGALNGILPCGLVYGALTTAAATGSASGAVLLMIGFGAGTSAILLALTAGTAAIPPSMRLRLRPLAPIVLAVTAAILLARGAMPAHQHGAPAAAEHHHLHE
jgi:uncharacterized protein